MHNLLNAFTCVVILFTCLVPLSACTTTAPVPNSPQPISVTTLSKASQSWNGSLLPAYQAGQPEVTILRIVIQPGVSLAWHKHPIINAGIVLNGQIRVESEQGEVKEFKQGETIIELVNHWHHGGNNGTEPAELIVFYAGTVGTPLSIARKTDPSPSH